MIYTQVSMYNQSKINPNDVIQQTEKLVLKINSGPDSNNVRRNKLGGLYALRSEVFYKAGKYHNSIDEVMKRLALDKSVFKAATLGTQDYIVLACNYVKLKDFKSAKDCFDSIDKRTHYSYELANFYETIGDKEQAMKVYQEIKQDVSMDHFYYYHEALKRIDELNKPSPCLLNEIAYPTENPSVDVIIPDNGRRDKIFELVGSLPEVKNCRSCGVSVFKEPKRMNSSNYWMRVVDKDNITLFDFYVDTLTFEIKFLDPQTGNVLTLSEWRKHK